MLHIWNHFQNSKQEACEEMLKSQEFFRLWGSFIFFIGVQMSTKNMSTKDKVDRLFCLAVRRVLPWVCHKDYQKISSQNISNSCYFNLENINCMRYRKLEYKHLFHLDSFTDLKICINYESKDLME